MWFQPWSCGFNLGPFCCKMPIVFSEKWILLSVQELELRGSKPPFRGEVDWGCPKSCPQMVFRFPSYLPTVVPLRGVYKWPDQIVSLGENRDPKFEFAVVWFFHPSRHSWCKKNCKPVTLYVVVSHYSWVAHKVNKKIPSGAPFLPSTLWTCLTPPIASTKIGWWRQLQ